MTTVTGDLVVRGAVPGPRQFFPMPIGPTIVSHAQRDPLAFNREYVRRYGDVFRWKLGPFTVIQVSRPEHVQHVLEDHVENYPRSALYFLFEVGVGQGMVRTEGNFWRRHRRMADPAFDRSQLEAWAESVVAATGAMLDRWRSQAGDDRPLDVFAEALRLMLTILGQKILGADLGAEGHPAGHGVLVLTDYINWRFTHALASPLSIPTPRNLRFRRGLRGFDEFIYRQIAERRREGMDRGDVLSWMIQARDEATGQGLTDQQLRDEMASFLLAAHEAIAAALAWAWYLVATHPEVESRLAAEVGAALGGRRPTMADLPQLPFVRRIVQETLRLYPTVWQFARSPVHDDEIGGYRIPAGTSVMLSPYLTHRHPEFWEDPERFDPDRFTPERSAGRHPYAYFPYCGGPHRCIGDEFATVALQLVLAMVAQAYRLRPVPDHPVVPRAGVTIHPRFGILMMLQET